MSHRQSPVTGPEPAPFPVTAFVASAVLHAVLLLSFLLGPALFADRPERFEYVPVVIMPAANLAPGDVARPAPRQAPPQPEPEPEPPEIEEVAVEPEAKKVVPEDVPVLRQEEPKKEPPKKKEPEPVTAKTPAPPPPAAIEQQAEPEPETPEGRPDGAAAVDPRYRAASTGSSQNAAVAGFTDPDFHFSYYLDRMVGLISQYWQPPPLRRQIQMVVGFRILADGTIEDISILESSGLKSFDDAGLRALAAASPMPPLPRGYQKPSLGVNLIIRNLGDPTP